MGGHLSHLEREEHPEKLDASCGPIRGNVYRHDTKIVDGYLGIPYAKPPIEMIKFHKDDIPDEANCLNLNVFAPRWESDEFKTSGRPVMVYVHGGGFELSAPRDYCHYSVSGTLPLKDVVVVTLNYRVGILGFFSTGDDLCRGNFGLWDQTLALKWIQNHIRSFGGDPNNVTVFGQSAGGVSVDMLSLSPHPRDLFHRVVPMSGNALWEKFEENRKKVYEFYAKNVDPNDEAKLKEKLVDFLGDTIFNGGTIACAQASVKYGNEVWFYVFDYVNPRGFGELEQVLPFVGPTHCTDLRYILGEGLYSEFKPDDADWEMIETMTTMYANFAKYGNPNGKNGPSHWEPYTMDHPERHYRIAYPRGEMREEYHKGRWEFIKMIRDNNKNLEEVVYGR
ncbi:hypothetical protein L5515_006560 [Caenorhabditis briggsae]|uniref:Carboxylic ester hydrolase n=1 Tax=Caenorhabditis briggsae TaxID=6238 RepID=A0AAE9JK54_CAEBR|nr:hypothetical protein L5515_006560 [Caenorhabditis briggsae]